MKESGSKQSLDGATRSPSKRKPAAKRKLSGKGRDNESGRRRERSGQAKNESGGGDGSGRGSNRPSGRRERSDDRANQRRRRKAGKRRKSRGKNAGNRSDAERRAAPTSAPSEKYEPNPAFAALGLGQEVSRAVAAAGYEEPTPVQREAIPQVLAGNDVFACAQTGTGKTAAFTLPLVDGLIANNPGRRVKPRALVLTPTRELALQVQESVRTYSAGSGLRSVSIFGGVGMQGQTNALRRGIDIVVATPGRLIDHQGRGNVDFGELEVLILDEADRMLDMGFLPDLEKILSWLPRDRQNLLFSATLGPEVTRLASRFTSDPIRVEVSPPQSIAATVSHVMHPVDHSKKRSLLMELLVEQREQTLVFCRTKRGSDRLAKVLRRDGISAQAIHGDKSQNQRTRALDAFKSGDARVLVATDVAARGLDIPDLPIVINYDLPNVPEDYIHRIGRTGRAGASGQAISLLSEAQVDLFQGIARLVGKDIEIKEVPGFEPENPIDLKAPAPSKKKGRNRRGRGRSGGGNRNRSDGDGNSSGGGGRRNRGGSNRKGGGGGKRGGGRRGGGRSRGGNRGNNRGNKARSNRGKSEGRRGGSSKRRRR